MNAEWIGNLFKKIKLPQIAKKHPFAFWTAVVFHLILLISLIFANVQRWDIPKEPPKTKVLPKAVTVDLESIKKEKQRLVDIEQKKQQKLKQEEQRIKELKRVEKKLENERYKEQQRLKRLKLEKEKLAKKQKELEKKRKLAEKKAKEAEKKAKEAKQKAKIAEKKKKELEKKRKVEADKFAKEQKNRALKKEIQAEEDQERLIAQEDIINELKTNYVNQIAARVRDKWRFNGGKDYWGCDVYILQDINGKVEMVNVQSCSVDDSSKEQAFKNSIERAVYKASPLPHAPDKSVFDREILFYFRVN